MVEDLEKALALNLGQRLADGFADEVAVSYQALVGSVDDPDDMLRP